MSDSARTLWGTNNIPCHEEVTSFLQEMRKLNMKDKTELTISEMKTQFDNMIRHFIRDGEYKGTIENKTIPTPDVPGGIPIELYRPSDLHDNPVIMVYFPGGGHVYPGVNAMHKLLSIACRCIIVDVSYRLAPENKLPTGMDDCVAAAQWVLEHKQELGGSKQSLVGVAGDSAGGMCCIYCTHRVKGLAFQVLVYPWINMNHNSQSETEFADGPYLTLDMCKWARDTALPGGVSWNDTRWSPVFLEEEVCKNQPPALVLLAELDPIRDHGRAYAKKLVDAGVPTEVYEVKGAAHIFFSLPDHFKKLTEEAYGKLRSFLDSVNSNYI